MNILKKLTIFLILFSILSISFNNSFAQSKRYPLRGAQKSEFYDGPYVVYKNNDALILTAEESDSAMVLNMITVKSEDLKEVTVYKSGFLPRTFKVKLRKNFIKAPTRYPEPDKMFVLSDIEGNFNTFTNLLQQHNVLDSGLNWNFGSGHLVIIGDVFDRGNHVTELLWLLYKLEGLAEEQGGMVHMILGNHETMNLKGDLRYINDKYDKLRELSKQKYNLSYGDLFGKDSELGRWLLSKNVIEVIGNKLFTHGGISSEFLKGNLSLEETTQIVLTATTKQKDNYNEIEKLVMGSTGPMWYRGHFREVKGIIPYSEQILEESLKRYNIDYIFVGHNIVPKPESRYNGRIIFVDVKPPADHLVRIPTLREYGVFIQNNEFTIADDNGNLEKMVVKK